MLLEIAFKGNRKEFFRWDGDAALPPKAGVIVEADRGEDFGVVHAVDDLAVLRSAGVPHGLHGAEPERRVLRLATEEERARARVMREQEDEEARRTARDLVLQHRLLMKLTDAEWQFDRKKLTLYFTAEKRVDFRTLVRDLASTFRTRIELKQIGVRDEARRLSGIGRCGREYCSASWLPELRPVNLGTAKDQKLSLNPTQISGACGRLMCCLRYEHEFYVQSRKRFPKEGKILVTSLGEEKVVANDIFRDRVTLRNPEGDVRIVPLAALREEMAVAAAGGAPDDTSSGDDDGDQAAAVVPFRTDEDLPPDEPPTRQRASRVLPMAPPGVRVAHPPEDSLAGRVPPVVGDPSETVTPSREREAPVTAAVDATAESAPTPAAAASSIAAEPALDTGRLPAADAAGNGDDAEGERDGDDDTEGSDAATGTGEDAPRKRRRRGRRGGRRGRGAQPTDGAADPASSPPALPSDGE